MACKEEKPQKTEAKDPEPGPIQEPLQGLAPAFDTLLISAEQDTLLELGHQSRLQIPALAFVDDSGHQVSGEVRILYRDFRDIKAIFLSGIPMSYGDSAAGIEEDFQTAGMFEIRAVKGDREVHLKPSAKLSMRYGSNFAQGDGKAYQGFYFDEKDGAWVYTATPVVKANSRIAQLKNTVQHYKNTRQIPFKDNHFLFSIAAAVDVRDGSFQYGKIEQQKKEMKKLIAEYGLDHSAIECRSAVTYNGYDFMAQDLVWKKIKGGPLPHPEDCEHWGIVKKKGAKTYRLEARDNCGDGYGEVVYTATIRPVMPLKGLFAYSPSYWKKNYEVAMAKVDKAVEELKQQSRYFQTMEINQLGIYNYDRFRTREDALPVALDVQWPKSDSALLFEEPTVYFLTSDQASVIKVPESKWDNVYLYPDTGMQVLMPMSGNRVYSYSAEQFAQIDFEQLSKQKAPVLELKMKQSSTIQSPKDLDNLLRGTKQKSKVPS